MPRDLNATLLRRRTILLIVAAALLLSQALGLLHGVVHAPQDGHRVVHAPQDVPVVAVAVAAIPSDAVARWLDRLFAAHNADGCASYDQLAHADFLWGHAPEPFCAAPSGAAASFHPAWQIAAQAAGYLARGPPRLA